MELGVILWTVIVWFVFFVSLKLLEHYFQDSLYTILERLNLSVSLGHIRWRTTYFNHMILAVGGKYRQFWRIWFNIGVYVGVICMVSSVLLLGTNLLWMFRSMWLIYTTELPADQPTMMLTPVIPGINVHGSQLLYLFLSLMISGVLHELGHAIAAVGERVKVNHFGLFVTILYPGAFVDLGEEMLNRITPIQQLRIFCAGSWHNLALAVFSLVLMFSVQLWMSPLYMYSNQGPYIVGVFEPSPFGGEISQGDIVTAVDNCTTNNVRDLQECLMSIASNANNGSQGYLIDDLFLSSLSETSNNSERQPYCCETDYAGSLQCFENSKSGVQNFYCLSARSILSNYPSCENELNSENCIYPVLPQGVYLLRLYTKSKAGEKKMHLFAGTPEDLWYSFMVRDYQIRWRILSFLPLDLPFYITTLLYYIASISAGLALLNLAPVFFLDGKWALKQYLFYLFPAFHEKATSLVLLCSTAIFVLNLVLSVGMLLYNKDPLVF
eukprot:TRINITY_DN241_c0_g1_i1.p1 TRINITY_DN241_c0_g1~~TRINITY_DN241_c0_g1_i1.p1  ORF type:complete len:496 (+),score=51.50 TRINITY_DN241_c0_g1_i1:151-1638(+)